MHQELMNRVIVITVLCCAPLLGQSSNTCPRVMLDGSPERIPVVFSGLDLQLGPMASASSVVVQNGSPRPINALFVVLNFYENENYLFSATLYAATRKQQEVFTPGAPFSDLFVSASPLSASLLPGGAHTLYGYSPVRPLKCPTKARVVWVHGAFTGQQSFEHRSPDARVDVWFIHPDTWPLASLPRTPGYAIVLVSIDEAGRPRVIRGIDSPMFQVVSELIEGSWKFLPASYDGLGIASHMWFVFWFGRMDAGNAVVVEELAETTARIVTIVEVELVHCADDSHPREGYTLFYGGFKIMGTDRLCDSS